MVSGTAPFHRSGECSVYFLTETKLRSSQPPLDGRKSASASRSLPWSLNTQSSCKRHEPKCPG